MQPNPYILDPRNPRAAFNARPQMPGRGSLRQAADMEPQPDGMASSLGGLFDSIGGAANHLSLHGDDFTPDAAPAPTIAKRPQHSLQQRMHQFGLDYAA